MKSSRAANFAVVLLLLGAAGCADDGADNEAPAVEPDLTAVMAEDADFEFDLLAHVVDPDGDALEIVELKSVDFNSQLALRPNGNLSVRTVPNYHGPLDISFKISDQRATVAGSLHITVQPVNDEPTAGMGLVVVLKNAARQVRLEGSDEDREPLSFTVVAQPAHGTLTGTPPVMEYTPAADFAGEDAFGYQVSDGKLTTPVATVKVLVVAPT